MGWERGRRFSVSVRRVCARATPTSLAKTTALIQQQNASLWLDLCGPCLLQESAASEEGEACTCSEQCSGVGAVPAEKLHCCFSTRGVRQLARTTSTPYFLILSLQCAFRIHICSVLFCFRLFGLPGLVVSVSLELHHPAVLVGPLEGGSKRLTPWLRTYHTPESFNACPGSLASMARPILSRAAIHWLKRFG
jgi:hypothetical protein